MDILYSDPQDQVKFGLEKKRIELVTLAVKGLPCKQACDILDEVKKDFKQAEFGEFMSQCHKVDSNPLYNSDEEVTSHP